MKQLTIMAVCLLTLHGFSQEKVVKTKQSITVNPNVEVHLNTNHVEIEIDTWDKNVIDVEAYMESNELPKETLQNFVKHWGLNINGSNDKVIVSSKPNGANMPGRYIDVLSRFSEMPELPELPELPEGVETIRFNVYKYKKGGEKYLKKWSKNYKDKGGEELQKRMEEWAKQYAKKVLEKRKQTMEIRKQTMEIRKQALQNRREKMLMERKEALKHRKANHHHRGFLFEDRPNRPVKKVIKITMPKHAKLKLNVRHGELKVSSLYNAKGNISHALLSANTIDGRYTSINVSYAPVLINQWNLGTLNLNFVRNAEIQDVKNLVLHSESSNVVINNVLDTALINGNYDNLTVSNLSSSFKMLNLVLENSDTLVAIPETTDYTLYFNGDRSQLNTIPTKQKTVLSNNNSNKTIIVNAKFSNVVVK